MPKTVTIIGNVGQSPNLHATPHGKSVCDFSLATYAGKDHEGHKLITWIKVTTWGKLAELVGEKVEKGNRVQVAGILNSPDIWLGKNDDKPRAANRMTAFSVSKMPKDVKYEDVEAEEMIAES